MPPLNAPPPLPPSVVSFLDAEIFSVPQLEVLLLVHAAGGAPMSVEEIAREFYLPATAFAPWLAAFAERGLLVIEEECFLAPPAQEEPGLLDEVAEAYSRRRVTMTRHIYASQKDDPARRFADAFRLRKDKP